MTDAEKAQDQKLDAMGLDPFELRMYPAKRLRIAQAILSDVFGWLVPWILLGILILIPGVQLPLGWIITLAAIAAIFSGMNIWVDAQAIRKQGHTLGMHKRNIYVVDDDLDHNIANVRRFRKKIRKFLKGEYGIYEKITPKRP